MVYSYPQQYVRTPSFVHGALSCNLSEMLNWGMSEALAQTLDTLSCPEASDIISVDCV